MAMNTSRGVGDGKYPTLGALETNADRAIREGDLLFIASTGEAYQATTDVSASVILNTSPRLYANLRSGGGSGGSTNWGSIGGTLANQTDLQNSLDNKVDTVAGKGLSENDYTDTDKSSVDALGSLSELDVPASDGKTYGVKDGALVEITSAAGGSEFKTIANSANIASIDSVWNPEANASVPEYISNAERHVIANPYGTSPVITKVFVRSAASGLTEWFDPRWVFNDSASASVGVAAEPLGSSSIVIQTATYRTVPSSSVSGSSAAVPPSINPTDLQVMVLVQKL